MVYDPFYILLDSFCKYFVENFCISGSSKVLAWYSYFCSVSGFGIRMKWTCRMRYPLTPIRMSIIKKSTNKKCWRKCGEKGTLVHWWQKCKLGHSLWKTVWKFLKILKIELLFGPAIPLLGIYLQKNDYINLKRQMSPNVCNSTT